MTMDTMSMDPCGITHWTEADANRIVAMHLRERTPTHWILLSHLPQPAYWRIRDDWYWGSRPTEQFVIASSPGAIDRRYWCIADRQCMSEAMLRGSLERAVAEEIAALGLPSRPITLDISQPIILIAQAGECRREAGKLFGVDWGTLLAAADASALCYTAKQTYPITPAIVLPDPGSHGSYPTYRTHVKPPLDGMIL